MSAEENHSGIPTRAIHESYLDMQRSLKQYRDAKDRQDQHGIDKSHGELQQNVLTFYELLRPHLKQEKAVEGYWFGRLPSYNRDPTQPPDPEDGEGIIHVQTKRDVVELNGQVENVDEFETLKDWHDALSMNGNTRITGIARNGNMAVVTLQEYQKGLHHLDQWETKYTRTVRQKEGFMSDKTEKTIERQRIPIDRLKRAARELATAADELKFLSRTGTPTNEDTRPI